MATPNKRRKKSYYLAPKSKRAKPAWREEICPGMKGILVSTSEHERLCVSEAYNLLNEYADQLYGPEAKDHSTPIDDVASSLEKEVDELRGSEKKPRRFQAINTGTKHLIFVKCDSPVEPVQLVHHMLSDVMELGKQKRFIPVSTICHTNKKDIEKCASELFTPVFYQDKTPLKFAVAYRARNNHDVDREEIIKILASLVTRNGDYPHRVDLGNPDLTIVVEIVKGNFCTSVVKDYNKLKRYNIQSVLGSIEAKTEEQAEEQTEAQKPENESNKDSD